jgi:hypothetical protein
VLEVGEAPLAADQREQSRGCPLAVEDRLRERRDTVLAQRPRQACRR